MKHIFTYIITLFLAVFFCVFCFYYSTAQKSSLYFHNLGFNNGLPSLATNSIVQDDLGFIWIGTEEVLCHFDAYTTRIFNSRSHPASLPADGVMALLTDGESLRERNISEIMYAVGFSSQSDFSKCFKRHSAYLQVGMPLINQAFKYGLLVCKFA